MTKNLNEIFTVERTICPAEGTHCHLARLDGGVVLLDCCAQAGAPGASVRLLFTFRCVRAGRALVQFAWRHLSLPGVWVPEEPMIYEIAEDGDQFLGGGWTEQHPLTAKEKQVFTRVTRELSGARYTPATVATRVLAGNHYRYVCAAQTIAKPPVRFYALLQVYEPLPGQGDPCITRIVPFGR